MKNLEASHPKTQERRNLEASHPKTQERRNLEASHPTTQERRNLEASHPTTHERRNPDPNRDPTAASDLLRARIQTRLRQRFAAVEKSILRALDASLDTFETAINLDLDLRFRAQTQQEEIFNTIATAVCVAFDTPRAALLGRCKRPTIAFPRMLAMTLCRRLTDATLQSIADHFQRDHGSVLHAARSIQNRCDTDPVFAQTVTRLEADLRHDLATSLPSVNGQ